MQEVLQRSPVPLGAGAIAESLGSHWGTVAELLIAREGLPPADRGAIEDSLEAEVELLWVSAEVRLDRPTVRTLPTPRS